MKNQINNVFFYLSNMAHNSYYLVLDKHTKDVYITSRDLKLPIYLLSYDKLNLQLYIDRYLENMLLHIEDDYVNQKFQELLDLVNLKLANIHIEDFPVSSVNGKVGNVVLKTSDLQNNSGYITTNSIPVSSVNGLTGDVKIDFPVSSVNGQFGNVIIKIPVSSVNGKTGNIILKTSDLENDSGYITAADIPQYEHILVDYPVSSVNNKTGKVVLKTSDLENDSGYITAADIPLYLQVEVNYPVSSVNGLSGDVVLKTSNIENDEGYYNNLSGFIKIIQNLDLLHSAENGYLYAIVLELT